MLRPSKSATAKDDLPLNNSVVISRTTSRKAVLPYAPLHLFPIAIKYRKLYYLTVNAKEVP
jgi:hypothetical protein